MRFFFLKKAMLRHLLRVPSLTHRTIDSLQSGVAFSPWTHIHHLRSRSTPCFRPLSIPAILPIWTTLVSLSSDVPYTFIAVVVHLNTPFLLHYPIPSRAAPTGHASHVAPYGAVASEALRQLRSKMHRPITETVIFRAQITHRVRQCIAKGLPRLEQDDREEDRLDQAWFDKHLLKYLETEPVCT